MLALLPFVSFAPTLDSFGQGTEMGCVLHACVSYVFSGTLARRKKAILSQPAIIIRISHDTPHSLKYNHAVTLMNSWKRGDYRKMQQPTRLKA